MNTQKWNLKIPAFGVMLILLAGCNETTKKTNRGESTADTVATNAAITTDEPAFQHLVTANIKSEKWDEYVSAMHHNIANSRQEPGNIIFTLYQPEDGSHKVAFMERFKNKAAFEEHMKANYLPKKATAESLIGKMERTELNEVTEVPAVEPTDDRLTPRNSIVFFDVKPEKRQDFIDAIAELTPHARQANGNVRFNIFQQVADENKFVLIESWESVADHETHLEQDHSKKFDQDTEGIFVSNPMDTRWLAKDISSE